MSTHSKIPSGLGARRDQTYQEDEHDSYKLQGKLKEPAVCPTCRAVFHKGRWTWEARPVGAHETLCPACHRIHDQYPKGLVTIKGSFKDIQHEQLIGVVKNTEEKEKKEHPLSRIMGIELQPDSLVISTTDTHLPRRIGDALKHAYHGELEFHYDQDEQFVRVTWTR
jgi:NMD protein affecting ribosome stability and mRNA decay